MKSSAEKNFLMATSQLLKNKKCTELWEQSVEHPFIRQLVKGSLPHDKFRDYIIQDKIFCESFRCFVCQVLADCPHARDFEVFHKRYSKKLKIIYSNEFISNEFINWKKVAKDYGGIEICPCIPVYKKYIWFALWDVASGCVWNTESIIKNTELIYEKKGKKYIEVR
jgi:thiaminase